MAIYLLTSTEFIFCRVSKIGNVKDVGMMCYNSVSAGNQIESNIYIYDWSLKLQNCTNQDDTWWRTTHGSWARGLVNYPVIYMGFLERVNPPITGVN